MTIDEHGSQFMELSKYHNMGATPRSLGLAAPLELQPANPGWTKFNLPGPAELALGHVDLRQMTEQRRSLRHYSDNPLNLDELSFLLWMTQGIKATPGKSGRILRTVPSAGARHPFETYLSINRISSLEPGLYHYLPGTHQLELVKASIEVNVSLAEAALNQQHIASSAVTFIWVANPERTTWAYGTRGYRYIFLDAGHLCQNLHLAAEAINCGICAIGAFDDDLVNQVIGIDGVSQFTAYMASLGRKPISG